MMEAVKVGQLDLIDALLRAGARLDVQVSRENMLEVSPSVTGASNGAKLVLCRVASEPCWVSPRVWV